MRVLLAMALLFQAVIANARPLSLSLLEKKPRLVVVMVIDQFRADYLTRFLPRFLPDSRARVGGFNYLIRRGAYFPYGQYEVLQNMTCPGHATVLTGAYPYRSGIPANFWFDREKGTPVYCVDDPAGGGMSPRNLLAPTVGDVLKNSGFASRVISLAIKDRAAILLGGHRPDLALWLDSEKFQWTTSPYYRPDGKLPDWVGTLNRRLAAVKGTSVKWERSGTVSGLSTDFTAKMIDPGMKEGLSGDFPHVLRMGTEASLAGPPGLELTETAAETAVESYRLGTGTAPDLLALSFSSHDYLGHAFGPNSLEMEELTVAEDKTLSRFFNFLNRRVPGGLANVLVVLTGDHGIPPNPDWLTKTGSIAGRIDDGKLSQALESHLEEKFGRRSVAWVANQSELDFFLSQKAMDESRKGSEVLSEAAAFLQKADGIARVFEASKVEAGEVPDDGLRAVAAHSFFPGRSGDLLAVPRPYFMPSPITVNHLTPYTYDSLVPILFAGPHVEPGLYLQARVVDIAPTVSLLLGILPPPAAEGKVLEDMLTRYN